MTNKLHQWLIAWGIFAVAFPLIAHSAISDDVKALVEQGKATEAYALAKKNIDQLGDPPFDFYFGIAAIDLGHAGEGVLALERFILNYPDNVSARLQLARGYFALGDDPRARSEFEDARKLNPPAEVNATIQRYLDAIRLRESRYTPTGGLYLEAGVGRDSNINSGVANANIFLPALGGLVQVSPTGLKTPTHFAAGGLGGYYSHPIAPGLSLFVNGQGERKFHDKSGTHQLELGNYNLAGGASFIRDEHVVRVTASYGLITLGSEGYRDSAGLSGEWQYQFDERQSISLGAQFATLRYSDINNTTGANQRDADFWGISAGYRRIFSYAFQPILSVGLSYGDQQTKKGRADLVSRVTGANIGLSFTPAAKWGVALGYNYLRSDYKGQDIILGQTREDRYDSVNATVSYLVTRNISVRGEVMQSKNRSNIDLYSFPRDVYAMKIRYEFK